MTIDLRAAVDLQRRAPRAERLAISPLEGYLLGSTRAWAIRAVVYARSEAEAKRRGYRHAPVDVWLNHA